MAPRKKTHSWDATYMRNISRKLLKLLYQPQFKNGDCGQAVKVYEKKCIKSFLFTPFWSAFLAIIKDYRMTNLHILEIEVWLINLVIET